MPKDIFEHKSIAKLVKALMLDEALEKVTDELDSKAKTTVASNVEQLLPTTPFSLTPIQHWFFEQALTSPAYWNQAILLTVKKPLSQVSLTKAVDELIKQHASLRLAFEQVDGQWQQRYQRYDADFAKTVVSCCDEQISEAVMAQYQQQFSLASAPLIRFVYFPNSNALLCTAHHLIVDAVSWQIIVEDLLAVYQQQEKSLPTKLPAIGSEFYQWQAYLASLLSQDNDKSEQTKSAIDYWQQQLGASGDIADDFDNSYAQSAHLSSHFDLATTSSLNHSVNAAYNTKTPELLITALVKTLLQHWQLAEVTIELEGHGREHQILAQQSSLDLSRTIGWFTSRFPQKFSLNHDLASEIIATKEQLRQVPDNGASYGVVRYLNDEISNHSWGFSNLVSFNYLGKRRTAIDGNFSLANGLVSKTRADDNQRPHLLDVNAMIVDDKLTIDWCYAKSHEKFADIEQLIQLFTANVHTIVAHCMSATNGRPTASDFPLAGLSEPSFVALLDEISVLPRTLSAGNGANFSGVLSQQEQD
jgi:non-ribosomal peptide synthase protein (TIGR01720 family)